MNEILLQCFGVTITGWKLVGFIGALMFTSRWFLQLYASKKAKRPVITQWFWTLSLVGSLMTLSYFIFGKNDSVGIIQNLFPAFIAIYNLYLERQYTRREVEQGSQA